MSGTEDLATPEIEALARYAAWRLLYYPADSEPSGGAQPFRQKAELIRGILIKHGDHDRRALDYFFQSFKECLLEHAAHFALVPTLYSPSSTPQLDAPVVSTAVPVIARAVAVFGDEHKASHWLTTPLPILENCSPSQILETPGGVQRIEQILARIEHNIPS